MRWQPARVAGFAATVGFTGNELGRAVALALATSDGDDGYRWTVGVPPIIDQRGLWGLDVVRWPDLRAYDLTRPDVAAGRAWELYRASGGTFRGFPQVTGDALAAVIPAARTAAAHPAFTQPLADSEPVAPEGSAAWRGWARMQAIADRLSRPLTRS